MMNPSKPVRRTRVRSVRLAAFALTALAAVAARAGVSISTPFSPGAPTGAPEAGHSYRVIVDPGATWTAANADAASLGGFLATIDNTAEQEYIDSLLVKDKVPSGAYWFGIRRSSTTGKFVFSSKSTPLSYTHWLPGEPNNISGNERYGSILWDTPAQLASLQPRAGFWNDLPDNGYSLSQKPATPDLVKKGYVVEFITGSHTTASSSGQKASSLAVSVGSAAPAPAASSVPLPAAVLLAPLGLGLAGCATRRFRGRSL